MDATIAHHYFLDDIIGVLGNEALKAKLGADMQSLVDDLIKIEKESNLPGTLSKDKDCDKDAMSYGVFGVIENIIHVGGEQRSENFFDLCTSLRAAVTDGKQDQARELLLRVILRLYFVGSGPVHSRPMAPFIGATELLTGRSFLPQDDVSPVSARIARQFADDQLNEQKEKDGSPPVPPSSAVALLFSAVSRHVASFAAEMLINCIGHARMNCKDVPYKLKDAFATQAEKGRRIVISWVLAQLIFQADELQLVKWDTFSGLYMTASMLTSVSDRGVKGCPPSALTSSAISGPSTSAGASAGQQHQPVAKRSALSGWTPCLHCYDAVDINGVKVTSLPPVAIMGKITDKVFESHVSPGLVTPEKTCSGTDGPLFAELARYIKSKINEIHTASQGLQQGLRTTVRSAGATLAEFYRLMIDMQHGRPQASDLRHLRLTAFDRFPTVEQDAITVFCNDVLARLDYYSLGFLDKYHSHAFTAADMTKPCQECTVQHAPFAEVIALAEQIYAAKYKPMDSATIEAEIVKEAFYGQTPTAHQIFVFEQTHDRKNLAKIHQRAVAFAEKKDVQSDARELALLMAVQTVIASYDETFFEKASEKSSKRSPTVYCNYRILKWVDSVPFEDPVARNPPIWTAAVADFPINTSTVPLTPLLPIDAATSATMSRADGYSGQGQLTRVSDHAAEAVGLASGLKTRDAHEKVFRQTYWLVRGESRRRSMTMPVVAMSKSESVARVFEYAIECYYMSSLAGEPLNKQAARAFNPLAKNAAVRKFANSRHIHYFVACALTKNLFVHWQQVIGNVRSVRQHAPSARDLCLHRMNRLPDITEAEEQRGVSNLMITGEKYGVWATSEMFPAECKILHGFTLTQGNMLITAINIFAVREVQDNASVPIHLRKAFSVVEESSPYKLFTMLLQGCNVNNSSIVAFFQNVRTHRQFAKLEFVVRAFYLCVQKDVESAELHRSSTPFLAHLKSTAHQLLAIFDIEISTLVYKVAGGKVAFKEEDCTDCQRHLGKWVTFEQEDVELYDNVFPLVRAVASNGVPENATEDTQ